MIPVGLGLDVAEVGRIDQAIRRWGDRFLDRVFTPAERAYCDARRRRAIHYAARFAAKEATVKALGTGIAFGILWRDVEVTRAPGAAPRIRLHGEAAARARRLRVRGSLLSITHTGDAALAAVLLLGLGPVENSSRAARTGMQRPNRGPARHRRRS